MTALNLPSLKHPFIKISLVIVLIAVGFFLLVQALVDKQKISQQLLAGIESVTGYKAQAGNVALSIFPLPKVSIERLTVQNSPYSATEYLFVSEKVDITLDILQLLMGEVKLGTITMMRPVVELEVFRDNTTNWAFLDHFSLSDLSFITPSAVLTKGGTINLTDNHSGQVREFNAVDIDMGFDETSHDVDMNISFSVLQREVKIKGIFEAKAFSSLSQYNFGLDLNIQEEENAIIYKGDFGQGRDGLTYDGVFSVSIHNLTPWMEFFFTKEASDGIFKNLADEVPLKISGKAKAEGAKYSLTEIKIKSNETEGNGQIISDKYVYPQTQAVFNFDTLDMGGLVDPKRPISDESFNAFFSRFLPEDISSSLDLRMKKFIIGGIQANDVRFMSSLDGGEMVINQAAMKMAGDTELLVFGIFKKSLDRSVQFDGSVELLGEHMLDFAHTFGFDKDRFVTDHDGSFRVKASIFFSRANSVISDFKLQAGTLLASGGMTSGQGQEVNSEYTLRVSGMKLDPFATLLIPSSRRDVKKSDFEDIMRRLDWLDAVKTRTRINLVLQDYSLSKTVGRQSTMHISIEPGKIKTDETEFELGGVVFSGSLGYDQTEEFPKISADISISVFNLEPFAARNLRKSPVERDNFIPVWAESFFTLNYLKGYHSDLDIRFKKILHPDMPMQNARLVATSNNGRWDIKSFRADIWDGTLKVGGTMDVTSIPAISLSFSLEEIQSLGLMRAFANHENFLGSINLNGQITTSGLNALNWVKNARGTFVILGQNIVIKGFDVSSLVQAIPSVRSVADVTNTVRVSMLRRHTSFSVVEGSFYLDNGVFKTSELKLRAKHSIGIVSGYMDLTTWMMDCMVNFDLITLARGDYPSIGIHFTNSMDDPEMTPDTRSLEAFIARKYLRQ